MAGRGWGSGVIAAVAVAAATGSAQLGLGYGLGIVSWLPDGDVLSDQAWIASLIWATWITASSVVVGAVAADRISGAVASTPPPGAPPAGDRLSRVLWRLVLSVASAIGALLAVLLIAVPARAVELTAASEPQTVAAGYAVLGVLVGLVLATLALTARSAAANMLATAAWLWLLAVAAVVDGVAGGGDWDRVPLGFWELGVGEPWFRNVLLPDSAPVLVAALVLGVLTALPAAWRGDRLAGVAVSGAAGPVLLAAAYLLAQPDLVGVDPADLSRYLVVPYVVLAGLTGSLLVSLIRPRRRPAVTDPEPAPPSIDDPGDPVESGPVDSEPTAVGTPATPAANVEPPTPRPDPLAEPPSPLDRPTPRPTPVTPAPPPRSAPRPRPGGDAFLPAGAVIPAPRATGRASAGKDTTDSADPDTTGDQPIKADRE